MIGRSRSSRLKPMAWSIARAAARSGPWSITALLRGWSFWLMGRKDTGGRLRAARAPASAGDHETGGGRDRAGPEPEGREGGDARRAPRVGVPRGPGPRTAQH